MKMKTFLILFSVLLSFSCSNEESMLVSDFEAHSYPQTWKLFKMTGSMANSETTGEDMAWQEKYRFNADGTVLKTRTYDGETRSINGKYELFTENDRQGIAIKYQQDSELISSCTGNEETLYFDTDEEVLYGSWWACDGPGLFYKR